MKFIVAFIFCLPFVTFSQVNFVWVDSLDGNYSFTEKWAYREGVFVNKWGQLSCDGLCPMEIDRMKDENGRIYDDSLAAFYSVVDTTHYYFTHEGEAVAYEFLDCHYALAEILEGKVHIQTAVSIITHTSLHIVFDPDEPLEEQKFKVYLIYNSIRDVPRSYFTALNGNIRISQKRFDEGMIQMEFDLIFQSDDIHQPQTWKGKILTQLD